MKKDDIYRSQFRLPYALYENLKESADRNNRSVNAELVARLEESYNSQSSVNLMDENKKLKAIIEKNSDSYREMKVFMEKLHTMLSNPE